MHGNGEFSWLQFVKRVALLTLLLSCRSQPDTLALGTPDEKSIQRSILMTGNAVPHSLGFAIGKANAAALVSCVLADADEGDAPATNLFDKLKEELNLVTLLPNRPVRRTLQLAAHGGGIDEGAGMDVVGVERGTPVPADGLEAAERPNPTFGLGTTVVRKRGWSQKRKRVARTKPSIPILDLTLSSNSDSDSDTD